MSHSDSERAIAENKKRLSALKSNLQKAGVHDDANTKDAEAASAELNTEMTLLAQDQSLGKVFRAVLARMEARLANIKAKRNGEADGVGH